MIEELTHEQQLFYQFIMERIQAGKEPEVRAIMAEVLELKGAGLLTKESMTGIGMKLMPLIRFECFAEFIKEAQSFSKLFV